MQSTTTCVHPSAMAARQGTASKTAASTRRSPRCTTGSPAIVGTLALALRQVTRSSLSAKSVSRTDWRRSSDEATTCGRGSQAVVCDGGSSAVQRDAAAASGKVYMEGGVSARRSWWQMGADIISTAAPIWAQE